MNASSTATGNNTEFDHRRRPELLFNSSDTTAAVLHSRCYTGPGKIVATVLDLESFQRLFMGAEHFLDLPCWASITHLVIDDYLSLTYSGGNVEPAGSAMRFGWTLYKSLLKRLLQKYPRMNLILQFHTLVMPRIWKGEFPCCSLLRYLDSEFHGCPRVGVSFFVNDTHPVDMKLCSESIKCFRSKCEYQVWLNDYGVKGFILQREEMPIFTGVFTAHNTYRVYRHPVSVMKIDVKKDYARQAALVYADDKYAGMMTIPLGMDRPDASLVPLKDVDSARLRPISMFNQCLMQWQRLASKNPNEPCSRCALPGSTCAAQSNAPGSCSTRTGQSATVLAADEDKNNQQLQLAGLIFPLEL